jgi:hypothetical protein
MTDQKSYCGFMTGLLEQNEKETIAALGDQAYHFVTLHDDCLEIEAAVQSTSSEEDLANLVHMTLWHLMKELQMFQFLFFSGMYPLLHGRIRYNWEMMFRCYHVQTSAPGSLDEKMEWYAKNEKAMSGKLMEQTWKKLFPLTAKEKEVNDYYLKLWKDLHQFVHPSAELISKLFGDSGQFVTHRFDRDWALDTIAVSTDVYDMIFVAALSYHQKAFDQLEPKRLHGKYRMLSCAFE